MLALKFTNNCFSVCPLFPHERFFFIKGRNILLLNPSGTVLEVGHLPHPTSDLIHQGHMNVMPHGPGGHASDQTQYLNPNFILHLVHL